MDSLVKINIGAAPNDGTGDPARDAFAKHNKNMDSIANALGAANGIATLGADGRLLSGQIPVSQTLPTTAHDLNTYLAPGVYRQPNNTGATAGANYPQPNSGLLEVAGTGTPGQTVQRYTVASTGGLSPTTGPRQYWRFSINTSWSLWQEVYTAGNSLAYQGVMASGQDLNNYLQRGMWIIGSSATAAGGTNFPIGQSGSLFVYSAGHPGGTEATSCTQVYNAANTNRQFFRSLVSGVWSAWEEVVRSSLLGVANGAATLGADGRLFAGQIPIAQQLPNSAHNLNSYTAPGEFFQPNVAQASLAQNYPAAGKPGWLEVSGVSGSVAVMQTYTVRNANVNETAKYWRVLYSGSAWTGWQEVARQADITTLTGQVSQTLGVGQTLQNMLPSRSVGVDYTNSTGRPITIYVRGTTTAAGGYLVFYIGVNVIQVVERSVSGAAAGITAVVPAGWSYRITAAGATVDYWSELR